MASFDSFAMTTTKLHLTRYFLHIFGGFSLYLRLYIVKKSHPIIIKKNPQKKLSIGALL
jgi:hypothetical protein